MAQPTPLYIIASPRPRVGKTLLARLMLEFFVHSGRPVVGFDLNPREPALAERFPKLVWPVDVAATRGQMELFDRLIAEPTSTKVIDLGYGAFDQFFAVMREIAFVREAQSQAIEPIVLFIADTAEATVRSYSELREQLTATMVPVYNESLALMFNPEDFPASPSAPGGIRIPRLSPLVRGVIDRPKFSFNAYMDNQTDGPTEIHQWIADIYAELRDFELRLLMGRLSSSLAGDGATKRKRRSS